ncbi:MAG: SpoIIE family protein phosphatase [Gammaproteobacteria bacterium]|nr:SpoIIE family protein phosphatase [Gammaproteobacteria bacterium]
MTCFDIAALKRPIQTMPKGSACGDQTLILDEADTLFFAVFDGAGHGLPACRIAKKACVYLAAHADKDLVTLLEELHESLKKTVGGVIGLCRFYKQTGVLQYSGIGNITARLFTPKSQYLLARDGVLGHEMLEPRLTELTLVPGQILILYSDGVKAHFDVNEFPDFFELSAYDISRILIDYVSKTLDDASCIVLKVNHD